MTNFFRFKLNLRGLLAAAGSLASLTTLTAFLGRFWWGFDLTSHFRVQYAAVLFLLAAVLCILRRWKTAAVFAAFTAVNCVIVIPYCYTGRPLPLPVHHKLRVLTLNVHAENRQANLVEAFIRKADPDLFLLEEVNKKWLKSLAGLRALYPYSVEWPFEDDFGIALFSKRPLENPETLWLGDAEVPSVTAYIQTESKPVRVLGMHPVPPVGAENARFHKQQLEAIPKLIAPWGKTILLLGDLNSTPWSPRFQKLLHDTGLVDSARGYGIQTTWPLFLYPLRIPVDHCLISTDLRVSARQIGGDVGSDHLPLLVDIALD
jgi:endonuclease/exonuclease/phosphatase (EEP) superfamily protein YafD